jgi:hypothetical protein
MASWLQSNPCKNCGNTNGVMLKCKNCGTLGCGNCVGHLTKSHCKVCKKTTEKIKV